jgi:hypothetical protein
MPYWDQRLRGNCRFLTENSLTERKEHLSGPANLRLSVLFVILF